jgi:excisionase family DNA binding protein
MRTLDIDECAEFLKIERTHALKLAGNGTLPGAKIGRAWVFLEDDVVEYLRAEVRKQMRERQVRACVDDGLAAAAVRTAPMVLMSPRAQAKRTRPDLSGFNDDGTPKLLSERA